MDKDFLNKKEPPTNQQILTFFFSKNEINEMLESLEYAIDNPPESVSGFGDPDEVETVKGTEWEMSRVKWVTEKGPKYHVYLKKVGPLPTDIDFSQLNLDYNYNMNSTNDDFLNPFFNFNNKIVDIEFEDIEPMTFQEQLDYAVENEEFEEAARLRDWNSGLIDLMKELKPKFIKAIEKADLEALDKYHQRLNDYRAKL